MQRNVNRVGTVAPDVRHVANFIWLDSGTPVVPRQCLSVYLAAENHRQNPVTYNNVEFGGDHDKHMSRQSGNGVECLTTDGCGRGQKTDVHHVQVDANQAIANVQKVRHSLFGTRTCVILISRW